MIRATSEITISKKALQNNINFIQSLIGNNCTLSSVVKGNAYGHGIGMFIPLAERCGVNHFSVFSAFEAQKVMEASTQKNTIMIMGVCDYFGELEWCIENEIEFFVYDIHRLTEAASLAEKIGKKARIHLELETGMNRTGFHKKEIPFLIKQLKLAKENLSIQGLCTHFAGAESVANYYRVKQQISNFTAVEKIFEEENITTHSKHLACSAGVVNFPKTIRDMVRVGIMQYGFWSNRETQMRYFADKKEDMHNPLKRLITWKTYVMGVKYVQSGSFIGYGTSLLAETNMRIVTIPVGYSHGFSRSLSNQGKVLIRGKRLDVIGLVNMNMMIVDATNLHHVEKGDEVVIIGKQGKNEVTIDSFGELSSQLNYELLTRLPEEIPRKVVL
ncbi:MAG: alanine racemase [Luteibaculaceae bacterium]